ncbi:PhoPQ-activated pathogenicity-related family protein [Persicitalea jodogahamensis]|uniref:PhoPQ-activated pathogenicity protein n=1 Tax=Persicitalea jodogahamensis TaxID=402147 RepID=A0A8J3G844_9BACT|nr:PhoPQ-activated protein PqaA family protein [Persicitalea jodogahamensis]GHB62673.1 PhoPQ-activated pathogenicity protein [Persicitalea jodogahamensis]
MKRITTALLFIFCLPCLAQEDITPSTALAAYLKNGDNSYAWSVRDSFQIASVKGYNLYLTSQKWHEYTWRHQLTVLVPEKVTHDGALLFVTGGSNNNEVPNWKKNDDGTIISIGKIAMQNNAITAVLWQTPNQPLFDGRKEDEIISYTLHQFQEDGDYSWPLLFPMVKSAVRAMDAVQDFAKNTIKKPVFRFVVSGASKRGWTTWLAGSQDMRVAAIGPMVIDMLNMPVNIKYHLTAWGDYSVEIQDYVDLGIPQSMESESGRALNSMIDPYSYRRALTMPKMIFIGTNDPYWPVDAVKNYYDSIPGKNLINYTPNAGHDLAGGKQALESLSAFFGTTLQNKPYPECSWEFSKKNGNIALEVKASPDQLLDAIVWSADSEDRDFRNETFTSRSLGVNHKESVSATVPLPKSGFKAFYMDLKYQSPNGGSYTVSTRVFVTDTSGVL